MLITAVVVALLAVILPEGNHRFGVVAPRPPSQVIRVAGNVHKVLHAPAHGLAFVPVPVRRIHVYDSKAALNLIASRELQRRRRAKGRGRPPGPGPMHHGRPPGRPPGPPKRRRKPPQRHNSRPTKATNHIQESHGTSPASSRVRYRTSPGPERPPVPLYADGYVESVEDNEALPEDEEPDRDRQRGTRREPSRHAYNRQSSRSKSKYPKDYEGTPKRKPTKSKTKRPETNEQDTYGWGDDGGYRVPAPTYPPFTPDDVKEPGTGHLDLEERFINQHSEFYKHGYPVVKNTTRSKKKRPQYESFYESDEGSNSDYENSADSSRDRPSIVKGRPKPLYSEDDDEDSGYSIEFPVLKTRNRSTRQPEFPYRSASHTTVNYVTPRPKQPNKFHAKFRKEESGEHRPSYYDDSEEKVLQNHRFEESHTTPSWQSTVTPVDAKPSTFRTRPTYPQYWG